MYICLSYYFEVVVACCVARSSCLLSQNYRLKRCCYIIGDIILYYVISFLIIMRIGYYDYSFLSLVGWIYRVVYNLLEQKFHQCSVGVHDDGRNVAVTRRAS
jgi:hypothetical protein